MSALYDMISALIALLMSAAFLHFGAAGDSRTAQSMTPTSVVAAPAAQAVASVQPAPTEDVSDDSAEDTAEIAPASTHHVHHHARTMAAHSHRPHGPNVQPAIEAVRAPSPARHS